MTLAHHSREALMVMIVMMLITSCAALFIGTDSSGMNFQFHNVDVSLLAYEYNLSGTVVRAKFNGCSILSTPGLTVANSPTIIVYVNINDAISASCYTYEMIANGLSNDHVVPALVLFSTNAFDHPLGFRDLLCLVGDPVGPWAPSAPQSPLNIANTPIYFTELSPAESNLVNNLTFPLNGTLTSNPSDQTIWTLGSNGKAYFWVLFLIYVFQVLYYGLQFFLSWYSKATLSLFSLRNTMLICIILFNIFQAILYAAQFGIYGAMSCAGSNFLFWSSFICGFVAFVAFMLAWGRLADLTKGRYSASKLRKFAFVLCAFGLVFFIMLTIIRTADNAVAPAGSPSAATFQTVFVVVYISLMVTVLTSIGIYAHFVIVLLKTLANAPSKQPAKFETIQRISVLALAVLIMMAIYIILLVIFAVILNLGVYFQGNFLMLTNGFNASWGLVVVVILVPISYSLKFKTISESSSNDQDKHSSIRKPAPATVLATKDINLVGMDPIMRQSALSASSLLSKDPVTTTSTTSVDF